MKYAKLVNGILKRAPNKVTYNERKIFNPEEEVLQELGYQKVTYTDMPTDAPEGQHYESSWTQGENEILQNWTLVDDPIYPEPELSAEEALAIIVGSVEV